MVTASQQAPEKATAAPSAAATKQHRAWWQTAGQALILGAAALAGLELFFGASGVGMEEILQPDPQFGTTHIPGKRIVWRMEGFSNDTFSSAGLRDVEHSIVKPAGTFRIALLGDSSTEGLQVPLGDTYGRQMEQMLRDQRMKTEVINFATSGYSTGQEVLQFERQVAAYKPDLTLLLYNRGDAVENVRKSTDFRCEPRPYFYLDGTGNLQEDDAVLSAYGKTLQPNPPMDFLRRNSRIYGIFSHANLNLSINEPLYRKLRGWVLTPVSPKLPTVKAGQAPYPPQDGWAVTSKLIQRLNDDCKKNGSKLLVVTFPNVVQDPEFDHQIKDIQGVSKQQGFQWFDLTPVFRWNPDPMSLFLKYHFSSKGHHLVAQQISEFIAKNDNH